MYGYRINITQSDVCVEKTQHFSGFHEQHPGTVFVECPNCKRQMFPALNLDGRDPAIKALDIWQECYLHILFCPFCAFYMRPHWETYVNNTIVITGGYRESNEIMRNIETPYTSKEIVLRELTEDDDPEDENILNEYGKRTKEDGVYHQIGGKPIGFTSPVMQCPTCNNDMKFAGILDYDDLNVPLYEDDHQPVALIIGDGNCMHFYTCKTCLVVGLQWVF